MNVREFGGPDRRHLNVRSDWKRFSGTKADAGRAHLAGGARSGPRWQALDGNTVVQRNPNVVAATVSAIAVIGIHRDLLALAWGVQINPQTLENDLISATEEQLADQCQAAAGKPALAERRHVEIQNKEVIGVHPHSSAAGTPLSSAAC